MMAHTIKAMGRVAVARVEAMNIMDLSTPFT
jgi:hypothetical protein